MKIDLSPEKVMPWVVALLIVVCIALVTWTIANGGRL